MYAQPVTIAEPTLSTRRNTLVPEATTIQSREPRLVSSVIQASTATMRVFQLHLAIARRAITA